jgi:hypothetical protein
MYTSHLFRCDLNRTQGTEEALLTAELYYPGYLIPGLFFINHEVGHETLNYKQDPL